MHDLSSAMSVAEELAKRHDGHFTLMRFTTGWKAVFGTPDVWVEDRAAIFALDIHDTAYGAVVDAIIRERAGVH